MKYLVFKIPFVCFIIFFSACTTFPISLKKSTLFDSSASCEEGLIRQGYITNIAVGDMGCPTGTQTCSDGHWVGPEIYDFCESTSRSCEDGSPHGTIRSGYLVPTTPTGTPCPTATTSCMNGKWVGPHLYSNCSETP